MLFDFLRVSRPIAETWSITANKLYGNFDEVNAYERQCLGLPKKRVDTLRTPNTTCGMYWDDAKGKHVFTAKPNSRTY